MYVMKDLALVVLCDAVPFLAKVWMRKYVCVQSSVVVYMGALNISMGDSKRAKPNYIQMGKIEVRIEN